MPGTSTAATIKILVLTIVALIFTLAQPANASHPQDTTATLIISSPAAELNVSALAPNGTILSGTASPSEPLVLHVEPGSYEIWASLPQNSTITQLAVNGTIEYFMNATRTEVTVIGYSTIYIELPAPEEILSRLKITTNNSLIINIYKNKTKIFQYTINNEKYITIWIPPGTYNVTLDYAPAMPANTIGQTHALQRHYLVKLDQGELHKLNAPYIYDILSKITLKSNSFNTTFIIYNNHINISLNIPHGISVSYYIIPGIYNITIETIAIPDIGDPIFYKKDFKISINKSENITIQGPLKTELFGKIKLKIYPGGYLKIEWYNGTYETPWSWNDYLVLWASPETYNLTYNFSVPAFIPVVGGSRSITWNTSFTVHEGALVVVNQPQYIEFFNVIVIWSYNSSSIVNITWENGSYSLFVHPLSYQIVLAYPGTYSIEYAIRPPPSLENAAIIGDISKIRRNITIIFDNIGKYKFIKIPDFNNITSRLVLVGTDVSADVTITWPSGNVSIVVDSHEYRSLLAIRGNYTLIINYIIDDIILLGKKKSIIINVSVLNNSVYVKIPYVGLYYKQITIYVNDINTNIIIIYNVSISNGTRTVWQMVESGEPAMFYVESGEYILRIVPVDVLNGVVIGDLSSFIIEKNITLGDEGGFVWSILGVVNRELTRAYISFGDTAAGAVIEGAGSSYFISSNASTVTLLMVRGVYNLTFIPSEAIAERVLGKDPLEYYKAAARIVVRASPGKAVVVSAPSLDEVFARLRVVLDYPGFYEVSWGNVSYRDNKSAFLYLVPGVKYVIRYSVASLESGVPVLGPLDDIIEGLGDEVTVVPERGENVTIVFGTRAARLVGSLASLVVEGPAGSVLIVEWPGGQRTLVLGDGPLYAYLIPGLPYAVQAFDPETWSVSKRIEIFPRENETIKVNINVSSFSPSGPPTVAPPLPGEPDRTVTLNITRNSSGQAPEAPPPPQSPENGGTWRIVALIEAALILILVFALVWRRRKR